MTSRQEVQVRQQQVGAGQGVGRRTASKGWSGTKKTLLVVIILAMLCCTPLGAIAFIGAFSGTSSVISMLMQNECEVQPGAEGGNGSTGGNVAVPNIVKNPPPALAGGNIGGEDFTAEQVRNAWIIVDVARQRGLPQKAWLIAMVTARKESRYHNYLEAVDHDSLGVFQQRPSTGWGTPEQITDVWYAANTFFGGPQEPGNTGLVDVPGWEGMEIHKAAEAVQRSAFASADDYNRFLTVAQAMLAHIGSPVAGVPLPGGAGGGNCNTTVVGGLRGQIVQLAMAEAGYSPTGENCVKYHDPAWRPFPQASPDANPCVEWCAVFVQAIWEKAGVTPVFETWVGTGVGEEAIAKGGEVGTWKPHTMGQRDGNPQPGDALVYGRPGAGPGNGSHVGIVVKVHPDGLIDTVEGNTGSDQVSFNERPDPATLDNGAGAPMSGYVSPPGG